MQRSVELRFMRARVEKVFVLQVRVVRRTSYVFFGGGVDPCFPSKK